MKSSSAQGSSEATHLDAAKKRWGELLQRKGQSQMFVWRERTLRKFYLRRTSDSSQMSRVQIRKTQENADLPVLVALMRLVKLNRQVKPM